MRVLHVITNLGQGGAEAVLHRLVLGSRDRVEHTVVSMMSEAYYGPRLREAGIDVRVLDNRRGRIAFRSLLKLRNIILETKPDIVQTWMYHADLLAGLVARLSGRFPVVWGVRNSDLDEKGSSWSARAAAKLCARLSRYLPASIVCCSERAAQSHKNLGYVASGFKIVPNGYDLSRFIPNKRAGERIRCEWGVEASMPLLGVVARWDAQKDHANLLAALQMLKTEGLNFKCALIGSGMTSENAALVGKISAAGLRDTVILLGPRDDIPAAMNALDVHVLPSAYGEAFPNVVAEAMACGTPCVVTDVGDAALIVGETGWVAPPRDPARLAAAIELGLATARGGAADELRAACRRRIEENFGIDRMVESYFSLWQLVANDWRQ